MCRHLAAQRPLPAARSSLQQTSCCDRQPATDLLLRSSACNRPLAAIVHRSGRLCHSYCQREATRWGVSTLEWPLPEQQAGLAATWRQQAQWLAAGRPSPRPPTRPPPLEPAMPFAVQPLGPPTCASRRHDAPCALLPAAWHSLPAAGGLPHPRLAIQPLAEAAPQAPQRCQEKAERSCLQPPLPAGRPASAGRLPPAACRSLCA